MFRLHLNHFSTYRRIFKQIILVVEFNCIHIEPSTFKEGRTNLKPVIYWTSKTGQI